MIKGTMGGSEAVNVLAMSVERRVRKADWRVAMRTLESMIEDDDLTNKSRCLTSVGSSTDYGLVIFESRAKQERV